MKRITFSIFTLILSFAAFAQVRYVDEVFTNGDIVVQNDVIYGTNFNPYVDSSLLGGTQVQPLMCDVYMPSPVVDQDSMRPVMVYLHTGSFLPSSVTGSCMGNTKDSAAVRICREFARRGYVAVSMTYRLGWLANSTLLDIRRGTNLLAVYYSIQDMKALVRYLNLTALGAGNPYGIDPGMIVAIGQGSGGYTTFGYTTVDKYSEVVLPKFTYQDTIGMFGQKVDIGDPYVDTTSFGDWDGYGGAATITGTTPQGLPKIDYSSPGRNIINHAGMPDDILMAVNLGGALGDSSWLEQGDVPMLSVHGRFDFFAPFYRGMVFVPIGAQFFPVVEVHGSHTAIKMANSFGNNAIFNNANYMDPVWLTGKNNVYNIGNQEGLFPFNIKPANQALPFVVNSNPWDYWDSTCTGSNGQGNPNDYALSKTYIDTVMEFIMPRIVTVLKAEGLPIGVEEITLDDKVALYPNPAHSRFMIKSTSVQEAEEIEILNLNGQLVRRVGFTLFNEGVDISGLSPGIYFVKINTDEGTAVKKLQIQ